MGKDEISVKAELLREYGKVLKEQASSTPYNRNGLGDYLDKNGGDARNELFNINSTTDICINVTRQLIECTARFMDNAANTFEDADYAMAKEVSGS